MIVRINQLDLRSAEQEAGWSEQGMLGPIQHVWPADTRVYEVLILDRDEQKRPVDDSFRQHQLRQLIPEAAAALCEPGEEIVIRLDGPLLENQLLPAMFRLTDPERRGRFAISPMRKLDPDPGNEIGSVRVQPSGELLAAICADASLGLERLVRLRVFAVPERLVNPLLDADATDDERWAELLGECGFVLTTTRGLRSLQVRTRRLEPAAIKSRLIRRLTHSGV
jgi:hypothetical protein